VVRTPQRGACADRLTHTGKALQAQHTNAQ
jgi:hypothetical protein